MRILFDEPNRLRSFSDDSTTPFIHSHGNSPYALNHVNQENDQYSSNVLSLTVRMQIFDQQNMGFSRLESESALRRCNGDVNQALEMLLAPV